MASTSTQQVVAAQSHAETFDDVSGRRRLEDLGLVMLVGVAPLIVSAAYLLCAPIQLNAGYTTYRFSVGLASEFATITLLVCLLRRQGRGLRTIGLSWHWTDIIKGFGLFLLSFVGSYCLYLCAEIAFYSWKHSYFHLRDTDTIFAGASALFMFIYGIAASFFEETLVRGYLMTELIGVSCPVWSAAIISVTIQASYHLYYGWGGAAFVSFGFAVSAIYFARSRRLLPVILSHLFWDLTATYWHWHLVSYRVH